VKSTDGLDCIELMPVDFTPMCAPSFWERMKAELGRPPEPADLPHLPLISPEDYWWDRWFTAAGVEAEHRPRKPGLRLDSQADEGHAAMGGQGFVLLTPAFWKNDIKDGRLCQPFDLTATAGFRYWLAIAPERKSVPKVKWFREWLLKVVAESKSVSEGAEAA
jgi:LysR family glycine cleavage system transcriptional activator